MADALEAFRRKFEELLGRTVIINGGPQLGVWQEPMNGHESEYRMLREEVSALAGVAEPGILVAGMAVRQIDRSTKDQLVLNPVAGWATVTKPGAMMQPDQITDAARMAEAKLRAQAVAARRDERSLAGRVAAVIGFPARVRELAGFPQASRAGKATEWSVRSFLFGVVVSIVGSLIAAPLLALRVLVW